MARKKASAKSAARPRVDVNPLQQKIPRHQAVWLEGPVPRGFWQDSTNRRNYLLWLGQQLGYRKLEDYYRIRTDDFKHHRGGGALLHCWNSSAVAAVMETFPQHDWKEWLFASCPRSFWKDRRNHVRYMEWLGERLGLKDLDGWYGVTNEDFRRNKGAAFLLNYDSTVSDAVKSCFPKHHWEEWRFGRTPKGFWEELPNRRRYVKWLTQHLGLKSLDDWYHVTRQDFESNCGNQLIKYYHGSPQAAAFECFPNHKWLEWKFARVPNGFWDSKANRNRYFDWLGRTLKLKTPEDWQRVRRVDLKNNFGGGLLAEYQSLEGMLQEHGRRKKPTARRNAAARR